MIKVSVFGASGRTGTIFIRDAVEHGYEITAFCRSASCASQFPDKVRVVIGNINDRSAVDEAIRGAAAVVCTLGQRPPYTEVFCAQAAATILESMRATRVKRLLCVTGAMVGEYPHRDIFIRSMAKLFARRFPAVAQDRSTQEKIVVNSGMEWTVVKPPRLTDGPARKRYRAGSELRVGLFSRISRNDLSAFLVDQIGSREYVDKRVVIEY